MPLGLGEKPRRFEQMIQFTTASVKELGKREKDVAGVKNILHCGCDMIGWLLSEGLVG